MSRPWHLGEMMGFDTETTGVDVENDRIVSITDVLCLAGFDPLYHSRLVQVAIDIPAGATKIHGITTEQARTQGLPGVVALDAAANSLAQAMQRGVPVVGMNLAYDFTILDRELRRLDLATLEERLGRLIAPVVDVSVIDKQMSRRKGKRTLTDLCQFYGVKLDAAHNDRFDAIAACRIAWRLATLHPGLAQMSLAQLHLAQQQWRVSQMNSLRAHFNRTQQKHDGCDPSWPIRPYGRVNTNDRQDEGSATVGGLRVERTGRHHEQTGDQAEVGAPGGRGSSGGLGVH